MFNCRILCGESLTPLTSSDAMKELMMSLERFDRPLAAPLRLRAGARTTEMGFARKAPSFGLGNNFRSV